MSVDNQEATLYLVGFRLDPDSADPQIYTIYVNDDRPIMSEGRPILFVRENLAARALQLSDCGAAEVGSVPTDLYGVFDIADAIYTLSIEEEAEGSGLLDCLNVLLDFVNCVDEPMPKHYRSTLEKLADHLTFNFRFAEFLESNNFDRQSITDAIYWTLGMIVYQMKIVTD